MKNTILLLIFALSCTFAFSQNPEQAQKLIDEGIPYHDKGDYEGAITRYDRALALDTNNLTALAEKALSYLAWEKYSESIEISHLAFQSHPGEDGLEAVYITCGNAYDELKKTDKSIETYDEGLKQFPESYLIHFNKGITLFSVKKNIEAMECFQKSVTLNPNHAGSNNAIAQLMNGNNRIPALLAFCRFFVIEPQTKRAEANIEDMQALLQDNVKKTGKKSISLTINSNMLADTSGNGKLKNSFITSDIILSMSIASNYDKKYKKKTEVENFIRNFSSICGSFKDFQSENSGFFWEYYVPYFIEMSDKKFMETFGYIAFASSDNQDVAKWLKSHKKEIDKFYTWSENYDWNK